MRRYLAREKIGLLRRLRIAFGRIGESEDDELAFAYHCGNKPEGNAYSHEDSIAAYMARAMGCYRPHHLQRGMGMIFKSVGLKPRGRLSDLATGLAWRLLQRRRRRFEMHLGKSTLRVTATPARAPDQ
jgi:hypothetical protein